MAVWPSGRKSRVARIVTADGDLDAAGAGQAITLTLRDELDISRGDLITAADAPAACADQFAANLLWMGPQPLLPGPGYWPKTAAGTVGASIPDIRHKVAATTHAALSPHHRAPQH